MMGLPLELVDYIISFVVHRSTLAACSLVSSSWTDFAHHYLFHDLTYVRGKWDIPSIPSLLEILQDTPSIAKHVRILDLEGGCDQIASYWCNLNPQEFAGLIDALPNLEEITMDVAVLHPSSPIEDFVKPVTLPKKLRRLKIGQLYTEFDDDAYEPLCELFHPIASIQILDIYNISSGCDDKSASEVRERCKTLDLPTDLGVETLILRSGSNASFVFLESIRRASPSRLRNLEFIHYGQRGDGDQCKVMQDFLNEVGLESVTISLMGVQTCSLSLSDCNSLRTLKFDLAITPREQGILPGCFNASLDALQSTSQIPFKLSLELGYLYLGQVPEYVRSLSDLDWERLGKLIAWHPCRVNKFTIICRGSRTFLGYDEVGRVLKEKLADLDSKGLLEIVQRDT